MINRHFLRGRVLQALYAYSKSETTDLAVAERNLITTINKLPDLFATQLSMLVELRKIAETLGEESREKFVKNQEEAIPHDKLANNALLLKLEQNLALSDAGKKMKLSWLEERAIFLSLYQKIRELDSFRSYVADEEASFEKDKQIVVKIFKNQLSHYEDLREVIFDKYLHWESDFHLIFLQVLRFLKESQESDDETRPLPSLSEDLENGQDASKEDIEFALDLFRKTILHEEEFEGYIVGRLQNWEKERIAAIDMILIKMGICEFIHFPTIPTRVTLNEYIELSKEFSTDKSKIFVNGLLDKLVVDIRMKGLLNKTGRGLGIEEDETEEENA